MKEYYLQAMGIDVWRLRSQPVLPAYYSFVLMNAERQPLGLLLADRLDHSEEEKQLALAMAKAMRLQVEEVDGFSLDNIDRRTQVLVLLGSMVSQHVLKGLGNSVDLRGKVHRSNHRSVIVSYSLSQLLADKSLKALAWKDLQCAMKAMGVQ